LSTKTAKTDELCYARLTERVTSDTFFTFDGSLLVVLLILLNCTLVALYFVFLDRLLLRPFVGKFGGSDQVFRREFLEGFSLTRCVRVLPILPVLSFLLVRALSRGPLFLALLRLVVAVHSGVRLSSDAGRLLLVVSSELFDLLLRLFSISALNLMNAIDGLLVDLHKTD